MLFTNFAKEIECQDLNRYGQPLEQVKSVLNNFQNYVAFSLRIGSLTGIFELLLCSDHFNRAASTSEFVLNLPQLPLKFRPSLFF